MNEKLRIKSKIEFENIITTGKKKSNQFFTIYNKERKLEFPRFGVTLGKKFGNAVHRNKYKRILREIIRNNQKKFENSFDYIIIMKKTCEGLNYKVIENNLLTLINQEEKWKRKF